MSIFFSRKILPSIVAISLAYVVLTIFLMNFDLVRNTILGSFPLSYKFDLLLALLKGMWTAMSGVGLAILWLTAILTAANLALLFDSIKLLRMSPKLHLVIGGNTLLGIVGSGCAACGLPIVSLLGLSGSLLFLPFHGAELSYLSVILLSISLVVLIRTRNQACEVVRR